MNIGVLIQLLLYEVLDIVPFAVLVARPFWSCIPSKKKLYLFVTVLYCMGVVRRSISILFPPSMSILSILWIILYLFACYYVIPRSVSKLLFVLITVLNYASMVAILYSYVGNRLFPGKLEAYSYCLEASLSSSMVLAVTYPLAYYWISHSLTSLMSSLENDSIWRKLWLVPAIFCIIFYYNLFTCGSVNTFSSNAQNVVFSLVISGGSFFVLSLVLKLAEVSVRVLHLEAEKHQLELHTLQYKRHWERIDEARRMHHDLRQYVMVLKAFLETGDTERLKRYIEKICPGLLMDFTVAYCSCQPLNALICYYEEMSSRAEIRFEVQIDFPEAISIQDTDLIVLFGNILENALEACLRQRAGNRFIHLKVKWEGADLVIVLDNSHNGSLQKHGHSYYSSKRKGYGIGLASIRQIAEKYHGIASFDHDEQEFHTSIMLYPVTL